jgi:hypothetical protein
MQVVYETIFSFSGGYNFLNRQVCLEFRQLAPKVEYIAYIDQLLSDDRKPKDFVPSEKIMEAAINKELLHVLEACREFIPKHGICPAIAKKGKLRALQWAHTNYPWDDDVCFWAACRGRLEILKWARANGFSWDEETCNQAASSGHLEVLQWLIANGCPWSESICSWAVTGDHLEVLQWLIENDFPCDLDRIYTKAITYGHKRIAGWMKNKYH